MRKEFSGIPYSKIGRLNIMSSQNQPDLLDLLGSISKTARDFFLVIKSNMNWKTNEATVHGPKTRSESTMRARAVKELKVAKLARRINGNSFMISPYYLVPNGTEREEDAISKWRILK